MTNLFLGLDAGTQSAKAVIYKPDTREVIARGKAAYEILPSDVPGRAEQCPTSWLQEGKAAMRAALGAVDRSAVAALAVSGQQHGLVALDEHGTVIRPAKLWCDVESAPEAAELSRALGHELVPSFTASKILWLQRHEPQNYARMRHVLLPHDYVNYHLTGRMAMECGDASGVGLFDSARRMFDPDKMALIDPDLHRCFPELIGPNEMLGRLRAEVAEELGLTPQVGVAPGSGDNAMAALGAGAVRPGTWVLSLGTSGTLFGVAAAPVADAEARGVAPFCDATGQWLPLLCTMNCTTVTEEVRRTFGLSHAELTELAAEEAPGCGGVSFLPYLTGERTPNWPHATGALLGLSPGSLRPGLLYRAALEGATFSLLHGSSALAPTRPATVMQGLRLMKLSGLEASELRVVGGGSKNPLWCQIVADAFQLPLRFPSEPESAALGAALQAAAVHCGAPIADYVEQHAPPLKDQAVEPNMKNRQAYEEAFERHMERSRALFGQYT